MPIDAEDVEGVGDAAGVDDVDAADTANHSPAADDECDGD